MPESEKNNHRQRRRLAAAEASNPSAYSVPAESTILPEDIIVDEILLRLPVKSLFKFKCVSKRYNSIISDPNFCHTFLQRAYSSHESWSSSGLLSLSLLLFPYTDLSLNKNIKDLTEAISESSTDQGSIPVSFISPPNDHESHTILGSSNGLVLSIFRHSESHIHCLCVSNPLTKQRVQLPDLPQVIIYFGGIATRRDQHLFTYKIVRIQRNPPGPRPHPRHAIADIFSSDTGSWVAQEMCCTGKVLRNTYWFEGFAHKGILHWLNRKMGSIVTYDPFDSPDRFGLIGLPERKYIDSCLMYSDEQEVLKYCGIQSDRSISMNDTVSVWRLVDSDKGEWFLEGKFMVQPLKSSRMKLMVAPNPWNRHLICHPFCYPSRKDARVMVYNLRERSRYSVKLFSDSTRQKVDNWCHPPYPLIPLELCPWSSPFYPRS